MRESASCCGSRLPDSQKETAASVQPTAHERHSCFPTRRRRSSFKRSAKQVGSVASEEFMLAPATSTEGALGGDGKEARLHSFFDLGITTPDRPTKCTGC